MLAHLMGTLVLPDDGAHDGLTRFSFSDYDGFPLIGDANGGDLMLVDMGFGYRFRNGKKL